MAKQSGKRKLTASERRVQQLRRALVGGLALLAGGILIWGLIYSLGSVDPGEIVENTHYQTILDAPEPRPGKPVRVTEFFSWACIACRNFDPAIEAWRETLPEGVIFERAPVAFTTDWAVLQQAWLILHDANALAENHERLFRAIHDNGKSFPNLQSVADLVDGRGISREAFLAAARNPRLQRRQSRLEQRRAQLGVNSVPALVVADKYLVNMGVGRRQSLLVADHLIKQAQAASEDSTGNDQEATL